MTRIKKDKYKKARGGWSRILKLSCAKCGTYLFNYQKDGAGILKRLYVDRIFASIPKNPFRCACGELILSNVGNVGAVFRCPKLNMPMSLGPNAVVVKNSVYTRYLFLYFKGKVGQSKLKSITGGSSQPKFNKTDLRSLKSIFPSKEVTEKFNLLVDPIYKKIDQMELENQKLAALRDLLLPKLMKGEIRV